MRLNAYGCDYSARNLQAPKWAQTEWNVTMTDIVVCRDTQCVECGRGIGVILLMCFEEDGTPGSFYYSSDGELLTKDHIVPSSRGGLTHEMNMQCMCHPCNSEKADTEHPNAVLAGRVDGIARALPADLDEGRVRDTLRRYSQIWIALGLPGRPLMTAEALQFIVPGIPEAGAREIIRSCTRGSSGYVPFDPALERAVHDLRQKSCIL
jgi:5-methylcytosine-specific restriction endonuclease McrA